MRLKVVFIIAFLFFVPGKSQAEFQVYDALLYDHKPDLAVFNLKSIQIIYEVSLFSTKNPNYFPEQAYISNAISIINRSNLDKAIVDIERWPVTGQKSAIDKSINNYTKVIEEFKRLGVTKSIGYFGAPPVKDYWRAISNPGSGEFISWQKDNDSLKLIADAVDILYPSLYTFYDDQDGWIKYATAQISEARRLANGKPVVVFLWPKYHNSNRFLKNNYLPADFWRVELETAKSLADGVVIWGGWQEEWDPDASWWLETIAFINESVK